MQTVVAEGAIALPQRQKFVTHVKQKTVTGNVAEEDERTSKKVAPSDNEVGAKGRTRRPREPSETVASDGLTTKTTAKSSAT